MLVLIIMRQSINQINQFITNTFYIFVREFIGSILWTCNRIRLLKIVLYSEDNTRWRPRNREAHNTL